MSKIVIVGSMGQLEAAPTMAEFPTWLREHRTQAGMSQKEVADVCGNLTRQAVYRWEKNMSAPSVELFLKVLSIDWSHARHSDASVTPAPSPTETTIAGPKSEART